MRVAAAAPRRATAYLPIPSPSLQVTELRKRHAEGQKTAGINVKKSMISDILEENVLQPLLVSTSSMALATETVRMVLKIDDIIQPSEF